MSKGTLSGLDISPEKAKEDLLKDFSGADLGRIYRKVNSMWTDIKPIIEVGMNYRDWFIRFCPVSKLVYCFHHILFGKGDGGGYGYRAVIKSFNELKTKITDLPEATPISAENLPKGRGKFERDMTLAERIDEQRNKFPTPRQSFTIRGRRVFLSDHAWDQFCNRYILANDVAEHLWRTNYFAPRLQKSLNRCVNVRLGEDDKDLADHYLDRSLSLRYVVGSDEVIITVIIHDKSILSKNY